jgi:hypothetical protein
LDYTIIGICITAIIITFFIYMIIKDKKGGHLELDTKLGKLLLKTMNDQNANNNSNEIKEEAINDKKEFNKNDYITELKIYKEYTYIINSASLKVFSDCIIFLVKNNITKKSQIEYNNYATEKIKLFTSYYNEAFANSPNQYLKKINIRKVLGYYSNLTLSEFKTFYSNVYNNHLELDRKNKENIEIIKEKSTDEDLQLVLLKEAILNSYNEIIYSDTQLLQESLNNFNNVLLNLFYEKLEEIIVIEK